MYRELSGKMKRKCKCADDVVSYFPFYNANDGETCNWHWGLGTFNFLIMIAGLIVGIVSLGVNLSSNSITECQIPATYLTKALLCTTDTLPSYFSTYGFFMKFLTFLPISVGLFFLTFRIVNGIRSAYYQNHHYEVEK